MPQYPSPLPLERLRLVPLGSFPPNKTSGGKDAIEREVAWRDRDGLVRELRLKRKCNCYQLLVSHLLLTQQWSCAIGVLGEEVIVESLTSSELTSAYMATLVEAYSVAVLVESDSGNENDVERSGIAVQY